MLLPSLKNILFSLAILLSAIALMIHYLDMPYMYISNDTKKCSFIEYSDGSRVSCNHYNPKQRYVMQWSK